MNDYHLSCSMENEDEWVEHIKDVFQTGEDKSEDELLEQVFMFDFEFKFNEL